MPELCPVCGSTEPHATDIDYWYCDNTALAEALEEVNEENDERL